MPANPIKQRPTAVLGSAFTAALVICGYLFNQGTIPEHFVKQWGWLIVVAVAALVFVLLWFHVTPAVRLIDLAEQVEGGRLPDVDLLRIEAIVQNVLAELTGHHPTVDVELVGEDHPDAAAIGAPQAPTLSAGTPPA